MTPRPNSRRQRALDQLQIASDAIAKATTLLGGHPKVGTIPKKHKALWEARRMISSLDSRLAAASRLIMSEDDYIIPIRPDPDNSRLKKLLESFPELKHANVRSLRDDFEREYDKERQPQC